MTLRHMEIYIAVYQTGNVTKAAEALFITQPAVTRAVQEIEKYYGTRLFDRINRRLYVTEAGKRFYAYALHMVDSFEQMERGMRNWDETGVLCIGTSITVGTFLLPKVIAAFREKHPGVKLKATVSNGKNLQDALLNNLLDFAVIEGNIADEFLCRECIANDVLVPVLPPDSKYKNTSPGLAELANEPLLLRERGSAVRTCVDHVFAVHGLCGDPVLESVSTEAILQAVHMGLGISFLPEQLARQSIQTGFVSACRIKDEAFGRKIHLVWHKHKFLTGPAKEAMDLFRENATEIQKYFSC